MTNSRQRSCYNCKNFILCGGRQGIEKSLSNLKINIDGDATPGRLDDIFGAVANCCIYFEEDK